jgi:hypothetical protein
MSRFDHPRAIAIYDRAHDAMVARAVVHYPAQLRATWPVCIYCENPVTTGSTEDYGGYAAPEPAHSDCIDDYAGNDGVWL